MQQKSRSDVAWLPLILFVVVPIVGFLVFRQYGIFFLALFFNPVFQAFGQLFKSYEIEGGILKINQIFNSREIAVQDIQLLKKEQAGTWQKLFIGLPGEYYVLVLESGETIVLTPSKELIFNESTRQLYFRN